MTTLLPVPVYTIHHDLIRQSSLANHSPTCSGKCGITLLLFPQHTPKPILISRAFLSIDKSTDILDHIYSLPHPAQEEAQAGIRAIETAAMVEQEPQPGLNELIAYLESRGVRMGLCTRNFE